MPDSKITGEQIAQYRLKTYRTSPDEQVHTLTEALNFVNDRGLVFFWPIRGLDMPSLWCAAAGNRPVPNNHDDPGHITWKWKDDLIGKNKWYYAKVLRRKSTIISLDLIPNFFALFPSVHDGLEEITFHYKKGSISAEEKFIFQQIIQNGAMDSISLKKNFSSAFSNNPSRFNRALDLLQRDFRIVPSGISNKGRWHYAYVYQTVSSKFPDLVSRSINISKKDAFLAILRSYFQSNGAGSLREIEKLFGWQPKPLLAAISTLIANHELIAAAPNSDLDNQIFSLPDLG